MADAAKAAEPPSVQHLSLDNSPKDDMSSSGKDSTGYSTPLTEPSQSSGADPAKAPAATAAPIRTPFTEGPNHCKPIQRPELTSEQAAKYESLLNTVRGWTEIPSTSARNSPKEPITEGEQMWLTKECLLRYLRATSWSSTEAPRRILATLTWRREYGVDGFTRDYISPENETGKQVILGYDNNARPCLYMSPGRQNTQKSERQIQHLVFMLERVIDMMGPGQETSALLINFKNSTNSGSPSVGQGKQTLNILQGHYPERLGKALISDLPWYISTFFKLISPFIDPVTKEKMVFNEDLRKYVPPEQLDKANGGDADFEYEHEIYWPALCKMCEERRAAFKERWVRAGKRVGEYEAYLRGGDQRSLSEVEGDTGATKEDS